MKNTPFSLSSLALSGALALGAVDFVSKPKMDIARGMSEYAIEITDKIRAAAQTNGLPEVYGIRGEMRDLASEMRSVISGRGNIDEFARLPLLAEQVSRPRRVILIPANERTPRRQIT